MPESKTCQCPSCRASIDAHTAAHDDNDIQPEPGDYTVCFNCGDVFIFNTDMTLRLCPDNEISQDMKASVMRVANVIRMKGNMN